MRPYNAAGNEIVDTVPVVFRMFAPAVTGSVVSGHKGGGV